MITLSTGSLYPYGLNRIFKIAKQAGFDGLELILRPFSLTEFTEAGFLDSWDYEYIQELEKTSDINVATIHTPVFFEDDPSNWQRAEKLANNLGVNFVVCHVPYHDQPNFQQWFKSVGQSYKNNKWALLVENVDVNKMVLTVDEWSKLPALCFDINHALMHGLDVGKLVRKLENIKQFHISDYDGKLGHRNILDNKDYFEKVLSIQKVESYCLETYHTAFTNFENSEKVIDELKETVAFIRKCI